jgi:hypothetical protein
MVTKVPDDHDGVVLAVGENGEGKLYKPGEALPKGATLPDVEDDGTDEPTLDPMRLGPDDYANASPAELRAEIAARNSTRTVGEEGYIAPEQDTKAGLVKALKADDDVATV